MVRGMETVMLGMLVRFGFGGLDGGEGGLLGLGGLGCVFGCYRGVLPP